MPPSIKVKKLSDDEDVESSEHSSCDGGNDGIISNEIEEDEMEEDAKDDAMKQDDTKCIYNFVLSNNECNINGYHGKWIVDCDGCCQIPIEWQQLSS